MSNRLHITHYTLPPEGRAAGIVGELKEFGVYHFVNEGCCSWYDFAKEIFDIFILGADVRAAPIRSDELDVMYTARYLGAEGFDVLSVVLAFTGIFGVFSDLGLSTLMVREVARERSSAGIESLFKPSDKSVLG